MKKSQKFLFGTSIALILVAGISYFALNHKSSLSKGLKKTGVGDSKVAVGKSITTEDALNQNLLKDETDNKQNLSNNILANQQISRNIQSQKAKTVLKTSSNNPISSPPTLSNQKVINSSDDDWFPEAEIISEAEEKLSDGKILKTTILNNKKNKYPLIRIENTYSLVNGKKELQSSTAMLADHLILDIPLSQDISLYLNNKDLQIVEQIGPKTFVAKLKSKETINAQSLVISSTIKKLKETDGITAEPDYIINSAGITPNDPLYKDQKNLELIKIAQTWGKTTGSKNIKIAVLDTGIDYNHPDLKSNIYINTEEPLDGIDNDGNGFSDDIRGWNFVSNNNDPMDDNYHGTHCAGIIGAVGNNGLGIAGMNWKVSLMPVKILDNNGTGVISDAIKGLYYAVNSGAVITSNSWGSPSASKALKNAISYAGKKGCLVVATAGNKSFDLEQSPRYPASYVNENVITVGSTDSNNEISSFSNYGKEAVDIFAPGEGILSTVPESAAGSNYAYTSGTSVSVPQVAAALALIEAENPNINMLDAKHILLNSVKKVENLKDLSTSGGVLDLSNFIPESSISIASANALESVKIGTTKKVQWTSDEVSGNVKIELFNGSELQLVLASNLTNSGSFDWIIDSNIPSGNNYRIRISSLGGSAIATTSAFSIKSQDADESTDNNGSDADSSSGNDNADDSSSNDGQIDNGSNDLNSTTVTLTFSESDLEISKVDGFDQISLEGASGTVGTVGEPALPSRVVNVLVPGNVKVTGLEVDVQNEEIVKKNIVPIPNQEICPSNGTTQEFVQPIGSVYSSKSLYPTETAVLGAVQSMRGYRFVPVTVSPVRWIGSTKDLYLAKTIILKVKFEKQTVASDDINTNRRIKFIKPQNTKANNLFKGILKDMVANKADLGSMYSNQISSDAIEDSEEGDDESGPGAYYLIITNKELHPTFQKLADFRSEFNGFTTKVIDIEDIISNPKYDKILPSGLDADSQMKVRECIIDYVLNQGTAYVVLGGNSSVIPDRDTYQRVKEIFDDKVATDLYYAGIDGNWDGNHNEIFGEYLDMPDYAADVLLGRIPVNTAQGAESYIEKIKTLEDTNLGDYFSSRILLTGQHAEGKYENGPSDRVNDGYWQFNQYSPVYDVQVWLRRMYRDYMQSYGFHASTLGLVMDNVTSPDYILDTGETKGWNQVINLSHGSQDGRSWAGSYPNGFSALINAISCDAGAFDEEGCLAQQFIEAPMNTDNEIKGSGVLVGSSSYNWYSPYSYYGGPGPNFVNSFQEEWIKHNHTFAARTFYMSKVRLIGMAAVNYESTDKYRLVPKNPAYKWLMSSLNYLGDPAYRLSNLSNPAVDKFEPEVHSLNASPIEPLKLRFDRIVNKGHGNINIYKCFPKEDENSLEIKQLYESIPVTDSKVAVDGYNVTINHNKLDVPSSYYVMIDKGAFWQKCLPSRRKVDFKDSEIVVSFYDWNVLKGTGTGTVKLIGVKYDSRYAKDEENYLKSELIAEIPVDEFSIDNVNRTATAKWEKPDNAYDYFEVSYDNNAFYVKQDFSGLSTDQRENDKLEELGNINPEWSFSTAEVLEIATENDLPEAELGNSYSKTLEVNENGGIPSNKWSLVLDKYLVMPVEPEWVDADKNLNWNSRKASKEYQLPFPFKIAGEEFQKIDIKPSGKIVLKSVNSNDEITVDSGIGSNRRDVVFTTERSYEGCGIWVKEVANNYLAIRWINEMRYWDQGAGSWLFSHPYEFEMILYKSGEIRIDRAYNEQPAVYKNNELITIPAVQNASSYFLRLSQLPEGMNLDKDTGTVSGSAAKDGIYYFLTEAKDSDILIPQKAEKIHNILVQPENSEEKAIEVTAATSRVSVSGSKIIEPGKIVEPDSTVDFGAVKEGDKEVREFMLESKNNSYLRLSDNYKVRIEGAGADAFKVEEQPSYLIGPKDYVPFSIALNNEIDGIYEAKVVIETKNTQEKVFEFNVKSNISKVVNLYLNQKRYKRYDRNIKAYKYYYRTKKDENFKLVPKADVHNITAGKKFKISVEPDKKYQFVKWVGGEEVKFDDYLNPTTYVTLSEDSYIYPEIVRDTARVYIEGTDGKLQLQGSVYDYDIRAYKNVYNDISRNYVDFDTFEEHTLKVIPEPGYEFTGYEVISADNTSIEGKYYVKRNGNIFDVMFQKSAKIRLNFKPIFKVHVKALGGGSVWPSGILNPQNNLLNLTVTPDEGYTFIGFDKKGSLDVKSNVKSTDQEIQLLDKDIELVAVFVKKSDEKIMDESQLLSDKDENEISLKSKEPTDLANYWCKLDSYSAGSLRAADLNNDGQLDLIDDYRIFLQNDSNFEPLQDIPAPGISGAGRIFADFNGDGFVDVFGFSDAVIGTMGKIGKGSVAINDGSGNFEKIDNEFGSLYQSFRSEAGDLDNDGDLDLFLADSCGNGSSQVWLNDGTGHFTKSAEYDIGLDVSLVDIDGDDNLDAYVSRSGYRKSYSSSWEAAKDTILLNDGQGRFTNSKEMDILTTFSKTTDIDGDGDLDVLALGDYKIYIIKNNQSESPELIEIDTQISSGKDSLCYMRQLNTFARFTVGDLNGDGLDDILLYGRSDVYPRAEKWQILINQGNGCFEEDKQLFSDFLQSIPRLYWSPNRYGCETATVALADLNNDGYADFVQSFKELELDREYRREQISKGFQKLDIRYNNYSETANTKLEVTSSHPEGCFTAPFGTNLYPEGTAIVVSPIAKEGFEFVNWTDKDGNSVLESENIKFLDGNKLSMILDNDLSLKANFKEVGFPVRIVYGEGNAHPRIETKIISKGNSIDLKSISNQAYFEFTNWSSNNSNAKIENPERDITTATITGPTTIVANNSRKKFKLEFVIRGKGRVDGQQGEVDAGYWYTVEAKPAEGETFAGWNLFEKEPKKAFFVDKDMIINAEFSGTDTLALTVATIGNGNVYFNCFQRLSYYTWVNGIKSYGQDWKMGSKYGKNFYLDTKEYYWDIPLKALPTNNSWFSHWETNGQAEVKSSTFRETSYKLLGDNAKITAVFTDKQPANASLDILAVQGGRTKPNYGNYDFKTNEDIKIQAIPNKGYKFDHWEFVIAANNYSNRAARAASYAVYYGQFTDPKSAITYVNIARGSQIKPVFTKADESSTEGTDDDAVVETPQTSTAQGWIWGSNRFAQLGNGTINEDSNPAAAIKDVSGKELNNIEKLVLGQFFTMALNGDREVLIWGDKDLGHFQEFNEKGRFLPEGENSVLHLGIDQDADSKVPNKVIGIEDVLDIDSGIYSCVALRSDGTVWTWGYNNVGQLGDGTTYRRIYPIQVKGVDSNGYLEDIVQVASGEEFVVALKSDGTVYTWGSNDKGQLGDGSESESSVPVQVRGSKGYLKSIKAIATHGSHVLALDINGQVWSWGDNSAGQAGDGDYHTYPVSYPRLVMDKNGEQPLSNIIQISTGKLHTLALDEDGTVWSWGSNAFGQLDESIPPEGLERYIFPSPEKVLNSEGTDPIENVKSIAAGTNHSALLTTDGKVYVWGSNGLGEIGDGSLVRKDNPVELPQFEFVGKVFAGGNNTAVLRASSKDKIEFDETKIGENVSFTAVSAINEHGAVTVDPAKDQYTYGEAVRLIATPKEGFSFDSWIVEGLGMIDSQKLSKTDLTLLGDTKATAHFVRKNQIRIDNGQGSGEYLPGENIFVRADEDKDGMYFHKWLIEGQYDGDLTEEKLQGKAGRLLNNDRSCEYNNWTIFEEMISDQYAADTLINMPSKDVRIVASYKADFELVSISLERGDVEIFTYEKPSIDKLEKDKLICGFAYRIAAYPKENQTFIRWNVTGKAKVQNVDSPDTTVTIYGPAKVEAVFMDKMPKVFENTGQELGLGFSNNATLADLNNDGAIDAYVSNEMADKVYINDGSGNFTEKDINAPIEETNWAKLVDLNKDGSIDVVTRSGDKLNINLNDGNANFEAVQELEVGDYNNLAIAKLNDDQYPEIIVTYEDGNTLVFINDTKGNFIKSDSYFGQKTNEIYFKDINNDGLVDLVQERVTKEYFAYASRNITRYQKYVWLNDGHDNFVEVGKWNSSMSLFRFDPYKVDLNGDGVNDYVRAQDDSDVDVFLNYDGKQVEVESLAYLAKGDIALRDLDNDGDIDLFLADYLPNKVYRNITNVPAGTQLIVQNGNNGTTEPGPGTYEYLLTDKVEVNAVPEEGFEFDRWVVEGGATVEDLLSDTVTVNLSNVNLIKATFRPEGKYRLYTTFGLNSDYVYEEKYYAPGEIVQLNVEELPINKQFAKWTGNTEDLGEQVNPELADMEFVMPEKDISLIATYESIVQTVTIKSSDESKGRVVNAGTVKVDKGDKIVLEANPVDSDNYYFAGWVIQRPNDTEIENNYLPNTTVKVDGDMTITGVFTDKLDIFKNSGQLLGNSNSQNVELADLNNDGFIDAFVCNNGANKVWLNDGKGNFATNGQDLGNSSSNAVALGDIDWDGDIDAVVANNGADKIYLNDGKGQFTVSSAVLSDGNAIDLKIADFNEDSSLDIIIVEDYGTRKLENEIPIKLFKNDGKGNFVDAYANSIRPDHYKGYNAWNGEFRGRAVELADIDNDGDIDAIVATTDVTQKWLNNAGIGGDKGEGVLILDNDNAVHENLEGQEAKRDAFWHQKFEGAYDLSLENIDSDSDMDMIVVPTTTRYKEAGYNDFRNEAVKLFKTFNFDDLVSEDIIVKEVKPIRGDSYMASFIPYNKEVWYNKGLGHYTSDEWVGDDHSYMFRSNKTRIQLLDMNSDGFLDIYAAYNGEAKDRLWINKTDGTFRENAKTLKDIQSKDSAVADFDNNGSLDVFLVNNGPNKVLLNKYNTNAHKLKIKVSPEGALKAGKILAESYPLKSDEVKFLAAEIVPGDSFPNGNDHPWTIEVAPGENYEFVNWTVESGNPKITDKDAVWTTCQLDGDAVIVANFKYVTATARQLTVLNGTGGGYYQPGEKVKININLDNISYMAEKAFVEWSDLSDSNLFNNNNKYRETSYIIMPDKDVSIKALDTFIDSPSLEVNPNINGVGKIANKLITQQHDYTYRFSISDFKSSLPKSTYLKGALVRIDQYPSLGYEFVNWTAEGGSSALTLDYMFKDYSSEYGFVTDIIQLISGHTVLKANFREFSNIFLNVNDGNGSGFFAEGTKVEVNANLTEGKAFAFWSGDGAKYLIDVNSANTTLIMPNSSTSIKGVYKSEVALLTLEANPSSASAILANNEIETETGEWVDICAGNIPNGVNFDKWTVKSGNAKIKDPFSINTQVELIQSSTIVANFSTTNYVLGFGKAIRGNDSNSTISFSVNSRYGTVEAWFKTDNAGEYSIISGENFNLHTTDNGILVSCLEVRDPDDFSDPISLEGTVEYADGKWHHAAVSVSEKTIKLYFDGVLVTTKPFGQNSAWFSGDSLIGGEGIAIDELRIWNHERTIVEIKDNMFQRVDQNDDSLAVYFNFDRNEEGIVKDLSQAGNDAIYSVFPNGFERVEQNILDQVLCMENSSINVSAGYSYIDIDALANITITEAPLHGELTINEEAGTVTYKPIANYIGEDNFIYSIGFWPFTKEQTVTVNVKAGLKVADPISDIQIDEDTSAELELGDMFSYGMPTNFGIMKTASTDNPDLLTVVIDCETLIITPKADQTGIAKITVLGTVDGLSAEDSFEVTVNPVDDAPFVNSSLMNIEVNQDSAPSVIDLSSLFNDVDGDTIIKTLSRNTNSELIDTAVNYDVLTLTYQPSQYGEAEITVRGSANGLTVYDTFRITVKQVLPQQPVVTIPDSGLIYNGSMEDGRNYGYGWTSTRYNDLRYYKAWTKEEAHSGLRSLKLIDSRTTRDSYWRGKTIYPSEAARAFNVSAWCKTADMSANAKCYIRLWVRFTNGRSENLYLPFDMDEVDNQWGELSEVISFQYDVRSIYTYLMLKDGTGTVWFDDFCLEIADPPELPDEIIHEDGSENVSEWYVYDRSPGGIINTVLDPDNSSNEVIELMGGGKDTGYRCNFSVHETQNFNISWKMKYDEPYTVYLYCHTTSGMRYIYYTNDEEDLLNSVYSNYIHHGLGDNTINGEWTTISRDLQKDLNDAYPNVTILTVDAFLIRGSGYIDDIITQK